MVFDRNAFLEFKDDEMYSNLQKAVRADASNNASESNFIPPQTAPSAVSLASTNNVGAITHSESVYNNGSTHWIDVYLSSSHKINLRSTYLVIDYTPVQGRRTGAAEGFFGCPIDPTGSATADQGYSIPFHIGHWFQNMYLFTGSDNSLVEQYVFGGTRFGDLCTARALLEYKQNALENASSMFTPCIERSFDSLILTPESECRTQRHLCGAIDANLSSGASTLRGGARGVALGEVTNVQKMQICVPLSDLLASACNPGYLVNSSKIRLQFTMKNPTDIPFCAGTVVDDATGASSGSQRSARNIYNAANTCTDVAIFVNMVRLFVDSSKMTVPQVVDTAVEHKEGIPTNIPYMEYYPIPSIQSQQIVVTGQSNVSTVVLGFDAYASNVLVSGVPAHGWVQNYAQKDTGKLTSLSVLYGTDMCTKNPIQQFTPNLFGNVEPTMPSSNAIAYALYRKASCSDRANLLAPCVSPWRFFVYNFYYLPIFPAHMLHITADPRDVRIDNTGPTGRSIVTIIKRFNGVQISSNGTADKMN